MSEPTNGAPVSAGDADRRRRKLVIGGTAALAAGAGAGVAWWQFRPAQADPAAVDALWSQSFETPAGTPLSMAGLRGNSLLLNFWATWCPPCVEEMPLLDAFFRQQQPKGWQVLGLAIDQPSAVRKFLGRVPVTFPIGMAGLGGTELAKSLGNLGGGLPFTVVLGPGGEVRQRRMGKLTADDLAQWAAAA